MAEKKNTKKLDLSNIPEGVYLNEISYGKVHLLEVGQSVYGTDEYIYTGKIHKGACGLFSKSDTVREIPARAEEGHGYTLEGVARDIFKVDDALLVKDDEHACDYVYINSKSTLKFVGDPTKNYVLHIRLYDNANGTDDDRWVVIHAEVA